MPVLETATTWALDFIRTACERRLNPVVGTVDRFRRLVSAHGIVLPQLLRYVPSEWGWSLSKLRDDDAMLASLDAEKLAWMSRWFGVELTWLEGSTSRVYRPVWLYKQRRTLWEQLMARGFEPPELDVYLFTDSAKPSLAGGAGRELAIVFATALVDGDGEHPRRYLICGDDWTWDHPPCRSQLLHLAASAWQQHQIMVPVVPIPRRAVMSLRRGLTFPTPYLPSCVGRYEKLEDWATGHDRRAGTTLGR